MAWPLARCWDRGILSLVSQLPSHSPCVSSKTKMVPSCHLRRLSLFLLQAGGPLRSQSSTSFAQLAIFSLFWLGFILAQQSLTANAPVHACFLPDHLSTDCILHLTYGLSVALEHPRSRRRRRRRRNGAAVNKQVFQYSDPLSVTIRGTCPCLVCQYRSPRGSRPKMAAGL